MNPNNYGTREASQRLVSNGIVLETDFCWINAGTDIGWLLRPTHQCEYLIKVPAPSMAEVWRELQEYIYPGNYKLKDKIWDALYRPKNNTTDDLIHLLIWLTAQEEGV
jgi:hypothetical protein